MKRILSTAAAAALGLAVAAPAAAAAEEPRQAEASIPFVNHGGIRDWRVEDHDTLYIQARDRQWYRVELMAPAHDLPWAWAIGLDTGPMNRLDRFSSIVVRGQRYPIVSLTKVEAPPAHATKPRRSASRDKA